MYETDGQEVEEYLAKCQEESDRTQAQAQADAEGQVAADAQDAEDHESPDPNADVFTTGEIPRT